MPWLELQLTVDAAAQPQAEAALEALGALAVTLLDANADTPDEAAIFEPGVGETPLWQTLQLVALFAADVDRTQLLHQLHAALPDLAPERIGLHVVADQDWERVWMERFRPMRFGQRLWVYPWNLEPPAGSAATVVVRLDPGLAFGAGTHPTTALCLEWLDALELAGQTLIDYGSGSGILAIAALKLGAAHAVAVDNDPQALAATRDNAARNGVAARLTVCPPDALPAATRADAFLANILARPLDELAPRFAALCRHGAPIALSGILAGQAPALVERYAGCGFGDLATTQREDWVRISGIRA